MGIDLQLLKDTLQRAQKGVLQKQPFSKADWQGYKSLSRLLFEEEEKSNRSVDELFYYYSETSEWPEMSEWDAYFAFHRIQCALDFVQMIQETCSPFQLNDADECSPLLWLCLRMWDWRKDHWLKMLALHHDTGDGFYGLDDQSS